MAGQLSATGIFGTRRAEGRGATADWMSGLCPRLWDVPLHRLSLPGSHDTMTYCLNRGSPVSRTQSRLLHFLSKAVPCITQPVVLKWSVTQTLDVSEQLAAGVRYLDLRVAHEPGGSRRNLHFVHMVYTTALVEDTLTEISEWLQQHPREVLVVACRNFEGLGEDLHEYLVTCIKNIFGAALCPRGEVPTLRQLWARGQQVLLSYEDEATVARHPELWPGIPYWWGDQVKSQALIRYLETMKSCGRPGGLFVAGTNLTESLGYILAHPAQSLAKLTLPALPALSAWVREQSPGPGPSCTNIIAGDFIGADTFVTDVIGLNQKLLRG
ncbi:PI-PLC X domain-containing protein 1 isoform X2 [Heterocephalus glaber]|nr:PI-PLC X domain-containing protein 1 isoform X2 [Heterocephalus glaber]XP_004867359.1 PI-PLC X domain-containing protein 1 isoform X2 [Heterocephalus glaber]XP_012921939.1 PI-PLC X domain-containing protein 1 isoform X2 [Heterocephalus glaber]XP_012921940.1 PI-PLC X domain-containing protein 1 isoform X2 [Heterocephalus glaber]XP_021102019.1 PI-PLC X domain-containing protein 1 isoform X2 [Heterocephalus glaber]